MTIHPELRPVEQVRGWLLRVDVGRRQIACLTATPASGRRLQERRIRYVKESARIVPSHRPRQTLKSSRIIQKLRIFERPNTNVTKHSIISLL